MSYADRTGQEVTLPISSNPLRKQTMRRKMVTGLMAATLLALTGAAVFAPLTAVAKPDAGKSIVIRVEGSSEESWENAAKEAVEEAAEECAAVKVLRIDRFGTEVDDGKVVAFTVMVTIKCQIAEEE